MSLILLVPDLPKVNLSPQAKAKLSVLTFLLQQSAENVLDRAMDALIGTLPSKDQELVPVLESRFIPAGAVSQNYSTNSRLADQIRAFASAEYVCPARESRERRLTIAVKEVHRRLGLVQRYPAVVSALQARIFLEDCKLRLLESSGAKQGSTKVLVFELL
jgi:ABC-type hemin transport system substrate-binding protein